MFLDLFYGLRDEGLPVSPTNLLVLLRAMDRRLVRDLDDLYVAARATLVKSERDFDAYDRVFLTLFGGERAPIDPEHLDALRAFLEKPLHEWLRDLTATLELSEEERATLEALSLEELMRLFEERLREQQGRHRGGSRFIGTAGRSPFGHSGVHPTGVRVGGESRHQTALKVAGERRYRDYARDKPLGRAELGDVFRMLRDLRREGPKDVLDVEGTIDETMRLGGEIELVWKRAVRDKLAVALLIDNGGFSMDPYTALVARLFQEARRTFRSLDILYFHNTVYDDVFRDARRTQPLPLRELLARDPRTRLLFVGDASMGAHELDSAYGNINYWEEQSHSSRQWLEGLRKRFRHAAWLNPKPRASWRHTRGSYTIGEIGRIIPMFDMTLPGITAAIDRLRSTRLYD